MARYKCPDCSFATDDVAEARRHPRIVQMLDSRPVSPFTRRALARELPASDLTGHKAAVL